MQQGLRIGIACAILIFSFIFVIIPPLFFILSKNASSKCTRRLFDLFNMAQGIAGGVLLSNALVHMIPESSYDLRVALVNTYGTAWYTVFPWSLALCGLVIMYMFVADRVLASITFTERCARACPPILTNIVLWFSLCAHSIFLGVALGTQQDDNVWGILVAIAVHQVFEAMAFGLVLVRKYTNMWSIVILLFFAVTYSAAIPVGIAIGLLMERIEGVALTIVQSCMYGVASGTFLYMSLLEILIAHGHHHTMESLPTEIETVEQAAQSMKRAKIERIVRYILFITSFVAMSIVTVLAQK